MEKLDFTATDEQQEKPRHSKYDSSHCAVYGCPRAGHIFTNNWNCRYHFGKPGESLARITLTLKNHAKDFDWCEWLLNQNAVDFAMNDIQKKAPYHLEVKPKETWKEYKVRVLLHIENLLSVAQETA
jgi:hypothetical protein